MMTNRSHKLLSLIIPISVLAAGGAALAQDAAPQHLARAGVVTATISNGLPADGCSYPVTIDGVNYAPDAASVAAVDDRVPGGGSITVRIAYRLTGGTAQVQCGFGAVQNLPEIAFRVLRVIDDEQALQPGE